MSLPFAPTAGPSFYSSSSSSTSAEYEYVLSWIVDICLALSMFGCFCTVLTFMLFPDVRTYPIKLLVYLSTSIFFAQIFFYLAFYVYDTVFCIGSAMLLHYFFIADFIWTFCVAFNFYQMIVRRNRDSESFEKYYHIAAWGIPMIIVVVLASMKKYNKSGTHCYIANTDNGLTVFFAFLTPGLIVVMANVVIFFFIAREIHDTLKSAPRAEKQEKWKELRVYISIFVSIGLSWIFGFFMVLFGDYYILDTLFSFFTPLQGFWIFVCYCCNEKIVYRWARAVSGVIPWFKRFEPVNSSITTSTASTSRTGSKKTGSTASTASATVSESHSQSSLSSSTQHLV